MYLSQQAKSERKVRRAAKIEAKRISQFISKIDGLVALYGLDPDLPEIMELKRQAPDVPDSSMVYLRLLNPGQDVTCEDSVFTIHERDYDFVLMPEGSGKKTRKKR